MHSYKAYIYCIYKTTDTLIVPMINSPDQPIMCQDKNHAALTSNLTIRIKCDLCDFNHDMDDGARWAALSVSGTVDLLGFSHMIVCRK